MNEADIRKAGETIVNAAYAFKDAAEMDRSNFENRNNADRATDKALEQIVSAGSVLLIQFFVDINRIAEAMVVIADKSRS